MLPDILSNIERYVSRLISSLDAFHFHNLQHTQEVVKAAHEIGEAENLSVDEMEVLLIAAWFHNTGFRYNYLNHEEISKEIAREFLASVNYPENKIQQVLPIINATKMPQSPQCKLEKIICDADLHHLSMPDYKSKGNSLRLEWERELDKVYSDSEWSIQNIHFFQKTPLFYSIWAYYSWKQKAIKYR